MQYFRTLFVQYDFWCRGTLQEKLNSIFNHKQIVISFIQGDKPTKPGDESSKLGDESSKLGDEMAGDEMAWGRSDCKAITRMFLIFNNFNLITALFSYFTCV